MKPTVYLETSFISYLVARPSRDLIVAAQQEITSEWWETRRSLFELYVSELVLEESGRGDQDTARKRLLAVEEFPILSVDQESLQLAELFITRGGLPQKASADALHIALAATQKIDYLLTWNCSHIANAEIQKRLTSIARQAHRDLPVLCTPIELMGGEEYEERPHR